MGKLRPLLTISLIFGIVLHNTAQSNVQEEVYLQVNSQFLITGETLYFSAFANSQATGQPSHLSKILYVELIGKDEKPIFQQKIKLENGRGYGDFFLSSLIPSGNYQLLAYTRWMKNFKQYFHTSVVVINPFEPYEQPGKSKKLEVDFAPEGGFLIPEVMNRVVVRSNQPVTGRVATLEGEKVSDMLLQKDGWGSFEIKPEPGTKYQAILEDTLGQFHFVPLPDLHPDKCILQLTNLPGTYEFKIVGKTHTGYSVQISDGANLLVDELADLEEKYILKKRDLKSGIYQAKIVDETGKNISQRLVYHNAQVTNLRGDLVKTYSARSLVTIDLPVDLEGDVSISVKKTNEHDQVISAEHFQLFRNVDQQLAFSDWKQMDNQLQFAHWKSMDTPKEVSLLPELRGEIISGKIDPPLPNQQLIYSLSGEDFQIQSALTDGHGQFTFQGTSETGSRESFLSNISTDTTIKFILENQFLNEYPAFNYSLPKLTKSEIRALSERSIRNQVENAYFEVKKDSIAPNEPWWLQFPNYGAFYLLDDYNRFPQMHEHFIEYIPMVVARKNKNRSKIKVLMENYMPEEYDPLILLDGVPVTASKILDFNPYKVKSIGVINNRIYLGSLVADGLLAFETFDHDLMKYPIGTNQVSFDYQGLEHQLQYTFPEYTPDSNLDRIPDYREQLYWNPQITFTGDEDHSISFYTSDNTGDYVVEIDGYTASGEPVSIRRHFNVRQQVEVD